jgi:hypothetical protein
MHAELLLALAVLGGFVGVRFGEAAGMQGRLGVPLQQKPQGQVESQWKQSK